MKKKGEEQEVENMRELQEEMKATQEKLEKEIVDMQAKLEDILKENGSLTTAKDELKRSYLKVPKELMIWKSKG